jgi:hypothetical protein
MHKLISIHEETRSGNAQFNVIKSTQIRPKAVRLDSTIHVGS